jgi:hypothetical protein
MLFADAALATRIETAECALSLAIVQAVARRGADALSIPIGGGAAVFTGVGSPINKVVGAGFAGAPDEDAWEIVEQQFAGKQCPVRVELSTLAEAGVAAGLTRRGYVLTEFENVLGFDLGRLNDTVPPKGGRVTIHRDEGDVSTWIDTVVEGFAHPDGSPHSNETVADAALKQIMEDFARSAGFTRYLARVDGTVAGGAGLRVSQGIAQFCGASTIPGFRRLGVQSSLLGGRLADARHAGCDVAVVTTAPGSKSNRNAQRQGFELLYPRAVLVKDTTD